MQTIEVGLGERAYSIHIGGGLLARIDEILGPLQPTAILIVTNATVAGLYGAPVQAAASRVAPMRTCIVPDGEAFKTLGTLETVLDALLALGADRASVVVALGGGVVGDVAGFAAAVFMRGIRFVQVPTTLLAQVDSSVGGKTGVNHPRGKNLIGAFHQPVAVVADTDALHSLPQRELSAGLAEVIKHGLLADARYLARVEADLARLRAADGAALADAVAGSCRIKAAIVARDETERGERALLNLGHTFGHAIEALTGYKRWLHGEAVGCGLCLAADLSRRSGLIGAGDVRRVADLVVRAGLPSRIEGLSRVQAMASMRADKKARAGRIRFILLERIGRAVQREVPDELVEATLAEGGYL